MTEEKIIQYEIELNYSLDDRKTIASIIIAPIDTVDKGDLSKNTLLLNLSHAILWKERDKDFNTEEERDECTGDITSLIFKRRDTQDLLIDYCKQYNTSNVPAQHMFLILEKVLDKYVKEEYLNIPPYIADIRNGSKQIFSIGGSPEAMKTGRLNIRTIEAMMERLRDKGITEGSGVAKFDQVQKRFTDIIRTDGNKPERISNPQKEMVPQEQPNKLKGPEELRNLTKQYTPAQLKALIEKDSVVSNLYETYEKEAVDEFIKYVNQDSTNAKESKAKEKGRNKSNL